jgi:dihydrofolate synthase/folylpolyglutamate synthase
LTYFEFGTLAALLLFAEQKLDAWVLEVGLGGRLDAVNVVDPDCAVLTSIGIDHVEFLGDTRAAIGREKAGIFRPGTPAVISEPNIPESVVEEIRRIKAKPLLLGRDFGYRSQGTQWSYWGPGGKRSGLAHPALRGAMQLRNAAAAMTALDTLRERVPVAMQDVRRGLAEVSLPARFQVLPGRPQVILGFAPETIAVLGMLRDKDIAGVVRAVAPRITRWHLASLAGPRGMDSTSLSGVLSALKIKEPVTEHPSVSAALAAAKKEAGENDKIVVFGSFHTVAGAHGR